MSNRVRITGLNATFNNISVISWLDMSNLVIHLLSLHMYYYIYTMSVILLKINCLS